MPQIITGKSSWGILCRVGGIAALIAGLIFRRNIVAEVGLFMSKEWPVTVEEVFLLLQRNRLMGLLFLNFFDNINYFLVGVMFLALYSVLKSANRRYLIIALGLGLAGVTVYFASSTAFSMLSLSNQYVTASTEVQKSLLLAAGQSMLALIHFGTGSFISMFLVAVASMILALAMLTSQKFSRVIAIVGIIAAGLDLVYCIAFPFMPSAKVELLSVCLIPVAGLLLMIWHVMVGWRLIQLSRLGEISLTKSKLAARPYRRVSHEH